MEKENKIEIEKKYQFNSNENEEIEKNIQTIIASLKLQNGDNIINNDTYYDNDDILEAYKITVRKRVVNQKTIYTLKKDISNDNNIQNELYNFNSLEEVINFLKEKYNLTIEVLYEKMTLKIVRKKYVYKYHEAVIEILFDKSRLSGNNNQDYMIECKYISGSMKDYELFNQVLDNYTFLKKVAINKKELGEEHLPKTIENPFNKKVNLQEYNSKLHIYFDNSKELLEKLKKLNERKENIKELHNLNGPLEKPIVITISGTPRSGKTTCIDNLYEFFKKASFNTICVEEPAGLVYSTLKSKDEKNELLQDRVGFVEKQLKIGEEKINSSLNCNEILLCDRGILDTYIWYDMYYKLGMMDKKRYQTFLESLKERFPYYNQFYILYANSITSMYRDYQNSLSIEPRSTMNEENVQKYNSSLIRMIPTFEKNIDSVKFINTSDYKKMDASIMVANDLIDKIESLYRRRK